MLSNEVLMRCVDALQPPASVVVQSRRLWSHLQARPIKGQTADWLTAHGLSPEVASRLGVRDSRHLQAFRGSLDGIGVSEWWGTEAGLLFPRPVKPHDKRARCVPSYAFVRASDNTTHSAGIRSYWTEPVARHGVISDGLPLVEALGLLDWISQHETGFGRRNIISIVDDMGMSK